MAGSRTSNSDESTMMSIDNPERTPQPNDAHLLSLVEDIFLDNIKPYLDHKDERNLSVCHYLYSIYRPSVKKHALQQLLQAVVDDDSKKVKRILEGNPELLLEKPDERLVLESKYTWQKFYAESALTMAVKRKQIKMIELLLPYYDKLEQTEELIKAKTEALSAWTFYKTQKNAQNEDEIVINPDYATYAQSLIDVFKEETFPNGIPGVAGVPMTVALSEKTELARSFLFNILLPKKAVKLDDHIDPELFLLALYKAYCDNFHLFENWDQRDAFCVRMIGLAQSALSPETAKIFCEGLYYVVEENRQISARAAALKLLDGAAFYRSSRDSPAIPANLMKHCILACQAPFFRKLIWYCV